MTFHSSSFIRKFYPIVIILFFWSCTTEKPKTPIFKTNIGSVETSIKKIISFENIRFDGSENTYRNKTYTVLEVEIINPPMSNRLPTPQHEDLVLRNLGKQIVVEIQTHLMDPAEFQYYAITFRRYYYVNQTKLSRYYNYEINNLDELDPIVKQFK